MAGPLGLFVFNQVLNLANIDCRHLDRYSYGHVDVSAAGDTATVSSRDATGAVIDDQNVPLTHVLLAGVRPLGLASAGA